MVRDEISPTIPVLSEWITVDSRPTDRQERFIWAALDAGERSAIAFALETGLDRLIIDDLDRRKIARSLDNQIVGSCGLVVLARSAASSRRPILC